MAATCGAGEPEEGVRRLRRGGDRPIVAVTSHLPVSRWTDAAVNLPPLPDGVAEIRFSEFYKMPVGPLGLERSEKLVALEGQLVRLVGYFVFEDWSTCSCPSTEAPSEAPARNGRPAAPAWMKHVIPGRAMLCSLPASVSLGHYGLSEDLPPQVAFLTLQSRFGEPVFYRPGLFAVTGKLSLGNREEPDGRTSYVRISVDEESDIVAVGHATSSEVSTEGNKRAAALASPESSSQTNTP